MQSSLSFSDNLKKFSDFQKGQIIYSGILRGINNTSVNV